METEPVSPWWQDQERPCSGLHTWLSFHCPPLWTSSSPFDCFQTTGFPLDWCLQQSCTNTEGLSDRPEHPASCFRSWHRPWRRAGTQKSPSVGTGASVEIRGRHPEHPCAPWWSTGRLQVGLKESQQRSHWLLEKHMGVRGGGRLLVSAEPGSGARDAGWGWEGTAHIWATWQSAALCPLGDKLAGVHENPKASAIGQ